MFYRGERCTSDQAAATDEAYCELMRRVSEMARECEDAMAPASGERVEKGEGKGEVERGGLGRGEGRGRGNEERLRMRLVQREGHKQDQRYFV